MRRMNGTIGVLMTTALAVATLAPAGMAQQPQAQPPQAGQGISGGELTISPHGLRGPTLTVTGRANSAAAPDTAILRFGAVEQAESARAAQERVNQTLERMLSQLEELGIPREQIQTARLSLDPVYSEQRQPRPLPQGGQGGQSQTPRIVGYRAYNTLQVELTDLGQVGQVIDAGIGAGANSVEGLSFDLRDDEEAKKEALRKAVSRARAEAEAVAGAMGRQLGDVVEVEVGGVQRVQSQMGGMRMMAMAEMAADTAVEPGRVRVNAEVTVRYRLED